MPAISRKRTAGLAGLILLAGLTVYHALGVGPVDPATAGTRVRRGVFKSIQLLLHGSTPTLAWSPDSKRVAVAGSYEYYGFRREIQQHRHLLGIYVVELATRKSRRVSTDQGYHPLWLNRNTVAWGHSPYEAGTAGLYAAKLTATGATIRRLGTYKGVYHTLPHKRGGVLFFSGFPENKRWVHANARTGRTTKVRLRGGKQLGSWDRPTGLYRDQCLQKKGRISAAVASTGRYELTTATQSVSVPGQPYAFRNYGGHSCDAAGHCGPVKPCLSPNGRYLAYVTKGYSRAVFYLNVMVVPK